MSIEESHTLADGLEDEELMRLVAEGRSEAVGVLHGRHAGLVFGIAARSLDRHIAEEITQEVFVAVWRNAATFDRARGNFRSWLIRIVQRRVLNELRRRGRATRHSANENGPRLAEISSDGVAPDEEAWEAYRREAVREAVNALPLPQSEALRLAFLNELTHEQVAATLEIPVGTVKSRIRAAVQVLRGRLAPLVAAGLIVVGFFTLAGLRERHQAAQLTRMDRALQLGTDSHVITRRLGATSLAPAAAHGNYRGLPDTDLAIFTASSLPPAPAGKEYVAWAAHGSRWTRLGAVHPDKNGRALIIAEDAALKTIPDRVVLTLEPIRALKTPTGAAVLATPGQ